MTAKLRGHLPPSLVLEILMAASPKPRCHQSSIAESTAVAVISCAFALHKPADFPRMAIRADEIHSSFRSEAEFDEFAIAIAKTSVIVVALEIEFRRSFEG
jgi:hypothetical protein